VVIGREGSQAGARVPLEASQLPEEVRPLRLVVILRQTGRERIAGGGRREGGERSRRRARPSDRQGERDDEGPGAPEGRKDPAPTWAGRPPYGNLDRSEHRFGSSARRQFFEAAACHTPV